MGGQSATPAAATPGPQGAGTVASLGSGTTQAHADDDGASTGMQSAARYARVSAAAPDGTSGGASGGASGETSGRAQGGDPALAQAFAGTPAQPIAGGPTHATGAAAPGGAASPASLRADRAAETLLVQVVNRLRVLGAPPVPGLDVQLHHPDLGDVRILVSGPSGDAVQAEVIAHDAAAAAALSRAAGHLQATGFLSGISVEVHTGSGGSYASHGQQYREAPTDRGAPAAAPRRQAAAPAGRGRSAGIGVRRVDLWA